MARKIIVYSLLLLGLYGCEDFKHSPIGGDSGPIGEVSNVTVSNLPGGADIHYNLPKDESQLYVIAEFDHNNEKREVIASVYSNTLSIRGFNDTLAHEVNLYTVNRSERRSEPVKVLIHPETPPIKTVFKTIQMQPAFGGISVSLDNPMEGGYVVNILVDSNKVWRSVDWFFTALENRTYFVRGLESVPTQFGIYITDEWNNHSDTLVARSTPLFEEILDKTQWKLEVLPSDAQVTPWPLTNTFDDNMNNFGEFSIHEDLPQSFTVDLGAKYKLSRMKLYQRGPAATRAFLYTNPKAYAIWGSNTLSDDWEDWTLVKTIESIKPSGLPYGQTTNEDIAYMSNGEENEFPLETPAFRYVRLQFLETFAGTSNAYFAEFTLWGQKVN